MAGRKPQIGRSVLELDAQIAQLEARKRELQLKDAERLMVLAERVGLLSMTLSDTELEGALAEVAARFQKTPSERAAATRKPHPKTDGLAP